MPLTEEQLKRIEENRRLALEKRAAKNQQVVGQSAIPIQQSAPRPAAEQPVSSFFTKLAPNPVVGPKSNATKSNDVSTSDGRKTDGDTKDSLSRAKVAFILTTRTRFTVNVGFLSAVIETMKKMPSRCYEATTRKWNFALSDHDPLVEALRPLKSQIEVHPLPRYIIDAFKAASPSRVIPEVDLSLLDSTVRQALLPFQREGVWFGVKHDGRILLADDMGLGKTIQSLALAHYYKSDWPLLIVCPSSMKYSWSEAIRLWLPSVPLHHIQVLNSGRDFIDRTPVTICSYDLLSRKTGDMEKFRYGMLIFDESHLLKDYRTQRCKAATVLAKVAKRVILLSGTPVLSRPVELFAQIGLLDPKAFPGFHQFGIRYCEGKQGRFGWDFMGASNLTELQIYLEEKYLIRRLKSEVLSQLPEKRRQMVVLDPTTIQCNTSSMQAKASQMQGQFSRSLEQRGALLTYYSETGKAKQQAVCDYVVELIDSGRKMLCFAHHKHVLEALANAVSTRTKAKYIVIDGSVSSEERKKLCDKFQADDAFRAALLSITAANTGLTLTAADLVIFAELFWNPGVLTQAEDRAHRIGQKDSVLVQYLVARGTADDYLWPLVKRKLDILTEAGLSKENFNQAQTTQLALQQDSKHNSITRYFEQLSEESTTSPPPEAKKKKPM